MRAIQIEEFGGPDVLRLADLPVPEPGDGEVLIRVSAVGVNYADTHQRTNDYLAPYELPLVPGGEVAGVREDTGERVVAMTGTGGYAEYATAPAALTFPIPEGVDDATAVALLIQGLTAWHLYRTSAQLRPGESVVVHAAAGGVGSLAVQLGKPLGAGRVIATASTEDKRALAPFGRIVTYGIASREPNQVSTGSLMRRSRAVVGFWLMHCIGRPEMVDDALADLFERVRRGELRVHVGATYPLSEAARAQVDIAERRTTGKVLLDPTG